MKRCPECYEVYDNNEKFCEVDGQPLLIDPALPPPYPESDEVLAEPETDYATDMNPSDSERGRDAWMVGLAGVLLGIVICIGVYAAASLWTDDSDTKDTEAPVLASQSLEPIQPSQRPAPRSATVPEPEETETIEPEESPEPQPSPSPEKNEVVARLNQGPVSTGQRRKDSDDSAGVQTIIQMNDGTTVEVDAAWEDGQGVWYRRGGMVAFVDSQRVKAIIGQAAQKPSKGTSQ